MTSGYLFHNHMVSLADATSVINQLLPEPHAGLLSGILYGTKASLYPDLKDALIRSGTLHIVALSGMNITILSSLTATTLLYVFSRKITSLLTIVIIIGFVWFVGPSPSVVRAAIMGSLTLLSATLGRQRQALLLLIITGCIMLIIDRSYLTNVSFQLSFLATLGLILFNNASDKKKLSFFTLIKDDFRTTLAAQVFTIPIFFFQFHRLSLLSPFANVLIGWMIAPLTVLGLLLSFLGVLWLPLATPLSWIAWGFLEYLLRVVFFVSAIPFASVEF
jgi:competence protein ComEC